MWTNFQEMKWTWTNKEVIISLIVEKLLTNFSDAIKDNFSPGYLSLYHVSSPGLISNFLDHVFPILFSANSSTPSWTCCLVDKVLNLRELAVTSQIIGLNVNTTWNVFFLWHFFIFETRHEAKWHGHKWVRLLDDLPFDVVLILLGFWTRCRKIHTEENRVILYFGPPKVRNWNYVLLGVQETMF